MVLALQTCENSLMPSCQLNARFTHDTVYAPPATVFLHDLQVQIPTECLLTVVFPQNVHVYFACCVISIFFTCFRSDAPYLIVPQSVSENSGLFAIIEHEVMVEGLVGSTPGTVFSGHADL